MYNKRLKLKTTHTFITVTFRGWRPTDLRLLYVNDLYEHGGAELIMRELADAMESRGHETYLATASDVKKENHYKISRIKRRIPFMLRRTVLFNVDPIARRKMKNIIEKVKPDIIHCHNLVYVSLAPVEVAIELGIPCLVTVHDYWPVCLNRTLMKSYALLCEERGWEVCASKECRYRRYDKIIRPFVAGGMEKRREILSAENVKLICVSEYVRNTLERFQYPKENLTVVHNGVNIDHFKPGKQTAEKIILFVGRLIPSKGIQDFISAAKIVKKKIKDARFVVIGGNLEKKEEAVENPGKISSSELLQYYQKATCLCVPSKWPEPFPTVALEAMACGKPMVAYSVGGLPEIVDDNENGFLAQPEDVHRLSQKIEYLRKPEKRS